MKYETIYLLHDNENEFPLHINFAGQENSNGNAFTLRARGRTPRLARPF